MFPPTDISGIQRLLGVVDYEEKYISNKDQLTKPISDLLSAKSKWY